MSDSEPEGEDLARRAETIFTDLREHADWLSRGKLALDSMPRTFPSAALRLFFLWKAPAGLADNAEAVSRAALSQFCDKQEDAPAWHLAITLLEQSQSRAVSAQLKVAVILAVLEVRQSCPSIASVLSSHARTCGRLNLQVKRLQRAAPHLQRPPTVRA